MAQVCFFVRLRERLGPKLLRVPYFSTRQGAKYHKNASCAVLIVREHWNESHSRQGLGKGFGQCQFGKQYGSFRLLRISIFFFPGNHETDGS